MNDHTFAICAYKESPYLEECILSLKNQTIKSKIIMATSTPNEWINDLADKYQIPLYINKGEGGIAQDWNFAYRQTDTGLVTIAHQDDIYEPEYLVNILKNIEKARKPIILFTDYGEIKKSKKYDKSTLLKVKRKMLMPLKIRYLWYSKFVRRRILGFGNPICCPSVTYVMSKLGQPLFDVGLGSNLDWQTWEKLSKEKGEFVYIPKILMYHRIHEESTTSELINNNKRTGEDFEMFLKFWPKFIAKILTKIYSKSEKYNSTSD